MPAIRPNLRLLSPICTLPDDLDSYLASVRSILNYSNNIVYLSHLADCPGPFTVTSSCFIRSTSFVDSISSPQKYFFFPKRMRWHSKHAIAFSPLEVLVKSQWIKSAEFSSLYGEIRELFYLKGSSVYYAGTYKCIQTQDWFPGGVPAPRDIVRFQPYPWDRASMFV
jgi:hypothetical protein